MCLSFFLGVFIDKFHGVTLGKPAISPSSESPHHCILLLWWFCPSPSESGVLRSPSSRLIQLCNLFTALKHCPLFCSTYCTSINRPQAYITACWVRRCLDFFHPQQIRISGGRILGGFLSEPFQVSVICIQILAFWLIMSPWFPSQGWGTGPGVNFRGLNAQHTLLNLLTHAKDNLKP